MRTTTSRTTPLTTSEIDEFFNDHLPYRQSMLTTHKLISKDRKELLGRLPDELRDKLMVAGVEASLVACRMSIEFLGLGIKHNPLRLVPNHSYFLAEDGNSYEVKVVDLGGQWVDINKLTTAEQDLVANIFLTGHRATAHLTYNAPGGGQWRIIHDGIELVSKLLKENLYDIVNRPIKIR
jgi:hypothetical protein